MTPPGSNESFSTGLLSDCLAGFAGNLRAEVGPFRPISQASRMRADHWSQTCSRDRWRSGLTGCSTSLSHR